MRRARLDVELAFRRLAVLFKAQADEAWPMRKTIGEIRESHRWLERIVTEYMDGREGKAGNTADLQ